MQCAALNKLHEIWLQTLITETSNGTVDLRLRRLPRIPEGLSALPNRANCCHVSMNLLMKRCSAIIPRLPINLTSPSVMSIACISACRDDYQLTCLEICFHGAHAFQVCRKTQSSLASNITITFVITRHYTYRIDHGERERMCIINQPCSEPICFRSIFFFIKLRAFLEINALNPAKQFVIEEIHCY